MERERPMHKDKFEGQTACAELRSWLSPRISSDGAQEVVDRINRFYSVYVRGGLHRPVKLGIIAKEGEFQEYSLSLAFLWPADFPQDQALCTLLRNILKEEFDKNVAQPLNSILSINLDFLEPSQKNVSFEDRIRRITEEERTTYIGLLDRTITKERLKALKRHSVS